MLCLVSGNVINVRKGHKDGEKATVELYQKGIGAVVRISDVPEEIAFTYDDMDEATFYCKAIPWVSKKGNVSLVVKFVGEVDGK